MERYVRNFVRSSLFWLSVGVLIGISMAFWPKRALVYRPAHVHANLLGFVSMMIFGVAYHVVPRFTGNPLHRRALAVAHLWIANAGLAFLVSGWLTRVAWTAAGNGLIHAGAALSAVGAFCFVYNLWRTLEERPAGKPATTARGAKPGAQPLTRTP